MTGALDWVARMVMLVLAGLVSLSIIGAIAAIPSGSIGIRFGAAAPVRQAEPRQEPDRQAAGTERGDVQGVPARQGGAGATIAAAPSSDPQDWLESIAYALMALVGIAALATLILWRTLHERRRIADALESLDRRRI